VVQSINVSIISRFPSDSEDYLLIICRYNCDGGGSSDYSVLSVTVRIYDRSTPKPYIISGEPAARGPFSFQSRAAITWVQNKSEV
jgi:hypothetical protein